jgi:predicted transcriptional regulator
MHTINIELPMRNMMRTFTLDFPDALYERVQELAKKNEISINLLVATALADTILMPVPKDILQIETKKEIS